MQTRLCVDYSKRENLPVINIKQCLRFANTGSKIVEITPFSVWRGDWDGFLYKAARTRGVYLQYDELATMRDRLVPLLNKYDSIKGNIVVYVSRAAFWTLRHVYSEWFGPQITLPINRDQDKKLKGISIDQARFAIANQESTAEDHLLLCSLEQNDQMSETKLTDQLHLQNVLSEALHKLNREHCYLFLRRFEWENGMTENDKKSWGEVCEKEFNRSVDSVGQTLKRIRRKLQKSLEQEKE